MIRLLVLHGYTQSADVFSRRIGAIRKQLASVAILTFAEGPHVCKPADMPGFESGASDSLEEARAWYFKRDTQEGGPNTFVGFNETMRYLSGLLSEASSKGEPFDGVLGFSQGAIMGAMLTSALVRPELTANGRTHDWQPGSHPPFKFAILVSGLKSVCPSHQDYYPLPLSSITKTLHIIGTNDIIVAPSVSEELAAACPDAWVCRHMGGHFLPSTAKWRKFFVDYVESFGPGGSAGNDIMSPEQPRSPM